MRAKPVENCLDRQAGAADTWSCQSRKLHVAQCASIASDRAAKSVYDVAQ